MFSEDFREGIICPVCGPWSRGDFARYVRNVMLYHEIDLTATNQEPQFLAWFSDQVVPGEHEPLSLLEKLKRWNEARKQHAEMRGQ
jgi:hypothetical protein